jgi:hypothetical protein
MQVDVHICGFLGFYFLFSEKPAASRRSEGRRRSSGTSLPSKTPVNALVPAYPRLLPRIRGGGGKYEFASADCGLRIRGTDVPSGCSVLQGSGIVRRICLGRQQGGKWWEENFDFAQEMERGGKRVKKFPAKVGTKNPVLLGNRKGGGNFPRFPAIDPLECEIFGNQEDLPQMNTDVLTTKFQRNGGGG